MMIVQKLRQFKKTNQILLIKKINHISKREQNILFPILIVQKLESMFGSLEN